MALVLTGRLYRHMNRLSRRTEHGNEVGIWLDTKAGACDLYAALFPWLSDPNRSECRRITVRNLYNAEDRREYCGSIGYHIVGLGWATLDAQWTWAEAPNEHSRADRGIDRLRVDDQETLAMWLHFLDQHVEIRCEDIRPTVATREILWED
jgi:hypothetical protein